MAKTGYVINKGIQQVFTSGPFSGSLVTSSYSTNNNLIGPIIDTKISFISGTIDTLVPCNTTYTRYFLDPYNCPTSGCPQPIMLSAAIQNCESYDYKYEVTYNFISSSTYVPTTKIEYSTTSDFSSNIGSVIYSNTSSIHLPINVSGLSPTPIATSNVYFRAINYCVGSTSSSYSNIISASCTIPTICCTPTLNSVTYNFGIVSIDWSLGTGNCDTVNAITVQSSTNGITWTDNTGNSTSPRTLIAPSVTTYYRVISQCSGGSSTPSNTITYNYAFIAMYDAYEAASPYAQKYIIYYNDPTLGGNGYWYRQNAIKSPSGIFTPASGSTLIEMSNNTSLYEYYDYDDSDPGSIIYYYSKLEFRRGFSEPFLIGDLGDIAYYD